MLAILKDESRLSKLVAAILAVVLMLLAAGGRVVDKLLSAYVAASP